MIWQDIVISISTLLFSYALIPQIIHGFRNKKKTITTQTSVITFVGLYTISVCFFTLKLYLSAIMDFVSGSLWLIIFLQGILYKWFLERRIYTHVVRDWYYVPPPKPPPPTRGEKVVSREREFEITTFYDWVR